MMYRSIFSQTSNQIGEQQVVDDSFIFVSQIKKALRHQRLLFSFFGAFVCGSYDMWIRRGKEYTFMPKPLMLKIKSSRILIKA